MYDKQHHLPIKFRRALMTLRAFSKTFCAKGYIVIFSVAMVLALAVASECQSTNLSSLGYGLALWGWWACVASVLWKIGQRVPFLWSLTPKVVGLHVLAASTLGLLHILLLRKVGLTF